MFDNGTTGSVRALARGFFLALGLVAAAASVSNVGAQTTVVNTATVTTPAGVTDPQPQNNTSSVTLNVSPAATAIDFCAADDIYSIVNGAEIYRYTPATPSDVRVDALRMPVGNNVNALMISPAVNGQASRLLFHSGTTGPAATRGKIWAYDATHPTSPGWYDTGATINADLPRAGMTTQGVGYLVSSVSTAAGVSTAQVYTLTPSGAYGYTVSGPQTLTYDTRPSDTGSGDIAFDQDGFGWLVAGADLYRVDIATMRATRQTAFTNAPSGTNYAGAAFDRGGRLHVVVNASGAYYEMNLGTATMRQVATSTSTVANDRGRDLASCPHPRVTPAQLAVTKTLSQVNGVAAVPSQKISAGDRLTYSIQVSHSGGTVAATLYPGDVVETIPAHTTPVPGLNTEFTCTATTCSNNANANVIVGGSKTYQFTVDVDQTLAPSVTSITNTVAVDGVTCGTAGNVCSVTNAVSPPISAVDDTFGPVDGVIGNANVGNVLTDDTLGGIAATPSTVTITPGALPTGITVDPATGVIGVQPGTPAGTYAFEYTICEIGNTTNCDTATVTVTVQAVIVANDDAIPEVDGATGDPNAGNAYDNDTLGGAPVDPADITGRVVTPATPINGGPVPVLDPATGIVSVPPGTPAGSYTIGYEICETLNPTNCATATITVTVGASTISALDDPLGPVNGASGNPNAGKAYDNDTLGGAPVDPADVTGRVVTPATPINGGPVPVLDPATGIVSVPPGTPAGSYTIGYEICETLNPTNCATATITVTVGASTISALDDPLGPVNGATGNPNAGNAYDNDTLGGAPVDPADITGRVVTPATPINGGPVPVLDPATGFVSVLPGTPAGSYMIGYEICEALNPTNCATATVTVTVDAPVITTEDDTYSGVNGASGNPAVGNVLGGDTLNGVAITDPSLVDITIVGALPPQVTVDLDTGVIGVLPGTPAGTYTFEYRICEVLNPTNCSQATVTITVDAPVITAVDDTYAGVNGASGNPSVGNVLGGDTLNGVAITDPSLVDITIVGALPPQLTVDLATGVIGVLPGTPAGDYTFDYTICEVLNPTNCSQATVTITVDAPVITAVDDTYADVNGASGNPSVGSVLDGDTLNGTPITDPSLVTITTGALPAGVTVDPTTGVIGVAPGTPAGPYTFDYTICEVLNPSNCETASVTITVDPPVIAAVDDRYTGINGGSGNPAVGNVLDGDTLNGVAVDPALVTITTGTLPNGVTVDTSTGVIGVAPGTPAGSYTFEYTICEVLNPANCSTATVTIVVDPPVITAVDDRYSGVDGGSGDPNAGNVLDGDTLNGAPVADPSLVTITTGTLPPGVTVDPTTGVIGIAPSTPAGSYTFEYTICEVLNPSNCSTASVTIVVEAPDVTAVDDFTTTDQNTPVTIPVLGNDTLGGAPVNPDAVTITVTPPANGSVVVNPDGAVVHTPAPGYSGEDSFTYTVCETLNPDNCATATVVVTVRPNVVEAIDDDAGTVESGVPLQIVVVGNDRSTGAPLDPGSVTVITPAGHGSVVCANGICTYTPAFGFSGEDRFTYRVCDTSVPTPVCDTATVTVRVQGVSPLRVTKTASVREVKVGDLVRYTVVVENIGNAVVTGASVVDTPPAGFSYVDGSLASGDGRALSVSGVRPIRIASLDLAPGDSLTMTYLLRVGAGIRAGGHINQVQAQSGSGIALSNVATAQVQTAFDPVLDDSLVFGTVFDDRNGDGWQASAAMRGVRVQGGFAPDAYIAGSTSIDRGDGPQPVADASAPLLHGLDLDTIAGRQSIADPVEATQVVIRQRLRSAAFTGDFVLTSAEGATLRMAADGSTRIERSGDAAKGLSAAEPVVTRRVLADADGVTVEYVIGNAGIDERGIPGVRVASVEGLLIETDQYGRYHLVDVPGGTRAHGRNFILKVDPATLPPGTELTTANPLVRRVTPGLPVRFDFGVRLPVVELDQPGEMVELEIGEVLFAPDSSALRADMQPAIDAMAREVDRHGGGTVVITGEGGHEALAFARATTVRDAVQSAVTPAAASRLQVELRTSVADPHALVAGVGNGDVLLGTVLFDTDRASVRPEFAGLLDAVAARLEALGGGLVGIVGHADVRGSHAYNVDLGLRRARAVYDALAGRLSPEVRANTRVEASRNTTAPVGEARK
ncbi:hypothetical protein AO715_06745 [Xanthomonas sp. Mitacek01]|nr:hypothetical protein AO715_06745 [Xanthomonas sp. Mitacek01]